MALFNYSTKELTAKVVYYGPGLCGKTTNLQWIHEKLPIRNKGKMLSLATETDRTLFFDFLPIELGTVRGMKVRVQLYTVPGQVFYNATRRMVLKGADCVVFVADSQGPMLEANAESLENLRENLQANEIDPDSLPMVLQYNKRDLPNALPVAALNARLNPLGHPHCEAVAVKGQGVEETLKAVTGVVFRSLASKYGEAGAPAPRPDTSPGGSRPATTAPVAAPAAQAARAAFTAPPTPLAARAPQPVAPAVEGPDDLLDSLDLEPDAGDEELEFEVDEPMAQAVEPALEVSADELALDLAAPGPTEPTLDAADLLTSEAEVGDDLPDLTLSEAAVIAAEAAATETTGAPDTLALDDLAHEPDVTLELEGDEDLALELGPGTPAPSAAPVVVAAPSVAAPAASAVATPAARRPGSATVPPSGAGARAAVPGPPAAVTAPAPTVQTAPVVVSVPGAGPTELAIPIELQIEGGRAQVHVHVRLTLDVRLQR
jgi:signal recognition particle receptor subunit beta